jgi:GTP-binding protein YchF
MSDSSMLRAGLIGLGACGKTTLFRLLTRTREAPRGGHHAKADANVGISRVPDERLDRLAALYQPRKTTHATVEFADMAVTGHGGAKDLLDVAPFRNADALLHVVRMFRDEATPHPAGTIDPARDAQTMEDELILADLLVVERRLERLEKDQKRAPSPELKKEEEILLSCKVALEDGRPIRTLPLAADDRKRLRGFQFLSAKPLLLVLNVDESDLPRIDHAVEIAGVQGFVARAAAGAVPLCGKIELEIAELPEEDGRAFMADLGLTESGLDRVIRAGYDLLGYISFFTVGDDECRAWSIPRDTAAQVAAGEIHTDIQRGFIRAEVVAYDRLMARGSLGAAREHGELRLEGKEYVVRDGDVINFRFAT